MILKSTHAQRELILHLLHCSTSTVVPNVMTRLLLIDRDRWSLSDDRIVDSRPARSLRFGNWITSLSTLQPICEFRPATFSWLACCSTFVWRHGLTIDRAQPWGGAMKQRAPTSMVNSFVYGPEVESIRLDSCSRRARIVSHLVDERLRQSARLVTNETARTAARGQSEREQRASRAVAIAP